MSRKVIVPMLAITMLVGFAEFSEARQNRGGRAATPSVDPAAPVAAQQNLRLRAKAEDKSDPALVAADLNPEFHADYRMKKGVPELQIRVENFELGTTFEAFIGNLNVGSLTIGAELDEPTEASLDFKKGEWPVGLPMTLEAGTIVRIMQGTTVIFEAPFQVK